MDRVVSARRAAKLLGMDDSGLRQLLKSGKIKAHRGPQRWEVPLSEIRRWKRFQAAWRDENLFTASRAARAMGLSRQAVHQKLQEGSLRFKMIGPRRFIERSVVDEAIRKRAERAARLAATRDAATAAAATHAD